MEAAAEKSRSATVLDLQAWTYYIIYTRLPAGLTYYPICMPPTNSERLIGISDAFSAFVYGYPSSCPRAQCTPNKSVTTLRYTRRHGSVYTGHACRHLPSAVSWISKDRLLCSANITQYQLTIRVESECVDVGKVTLADRSSWVVEHSLCHKLRLGVSS